MTFLTLRLECTDYLNENEFGKVTIRNKEKQLFFVRSNFSIFDKWSFHENTAHVGTDISEYTSRINEI